MRKYYLFIVSILILQFAVLPISAQQDVKIKQAEFKIRKTGFKEAWKNVKAGDKLYTEGLGTYGDAIKHYNRAHRYNDNNPQLNYKMGVCYLASNEFFRAVELFEAAYIANQKVSPDIHYLLGRAYHLNLRFDQAIENYKIYYNSFSVKELKVLSVNISKLIEECEQGRVLIGDPVRVMINNLGDRINSEFDDYNPVLNPDESLLYFTSRRNDSKKDDRAPEDNKYFEEIFVSKKVGELWKKAELVDKKMNTSNNESVLTITPEDDKIYFYNGEQGNGDILVSEYKKGKWRAPKPISGKLLSKSKETSVTFSADGMEVYFVSDRGGSVGGKDIFYSSRNAKGKWTEPVNVGPHINTKYDEEGVFLDSHGENLYFSSRGHNSMGGYDIFVSEREAGTRWKAPTNLGYPINSPHDDIFFKQSNSAKVAYYSSVRQDGLGGKDIYKIIFLGDEKEFQLSNTNNLIAWDVESLPDLFYKEPATVHVDTALYLTGRVLDSKSNDPISGKIEIIDLEKSEIIATALSDELGNYQIKLEEQKDYGVEVTAKDYLFYVKMIYTSRMEVQGGKILTDFLLDKVEIGSKVVLNNIFFETNSSALKSESFEEIGRVLELLKNNPTLRLEISGHTDNVGSYKVNLRLSESRAKSVVDYLIAQGIDKKRLEYKGYSFTQPVADNKTAEGRSQNRRVEFKVLDK